MYAAYQDAKRVSRDHHHAATLVSALIHFGWVAQDTRREGVRLTDAGRRHLTRVPPAAA
jgi:hypothetical protein